MTSFLNSVLSTITDSSTQPATPNTARTTPNTAKCQNKSATTMNAAVSSGKPPSAVNVSSVPSNSKRKAEDELSRPNDKVRKELNTVKSTANLSVASRPISNGKPTTSASSGQPTVPYRGTGRPSPTASLFEKESKPAPKKGSFAEIMARQKAATTPIGVITHKPKEKLSSKKELELHKQAMRDKKAGKLPRSAPGSSRNSPGPTKRGGEGAAKPTVAKSVGYQGTAKPKLQPAYKGTMKPQPSSTLRGKPPTATHDITRRKSISDLRRRSSYSDEDNEESGEEEEGSYISEEDYSDMEAGFEDVEEEDEKAARIAKKEDDYEKMMLDELARQKEAKKKRLAALAEKARRR